ncbi:MAG: UDP-N-acetylglucosamine 4,6-dehydratase (inverting) [Magnetovibrio sp.]|nr:UDP-N-acetylglucosamine 4,6-dehydratase (inverting) [Magnetovibrio sp.]
MNDLKNKSVLVTGGTGSFGQAFVRWILENAEPRRVVVYSRDELKQFEMAQEINAPQLRYFIGDVRDNDRLRRALDGIDTIVHAAAMKQVVAAEYNPIECIKTNILGAENIINAAIDCGVKDVIALSTDKAVNPVNLYGATKLCSDKLFIAANHMGRRGPTRFSVVRYGNVIGSRGSVVPFFMKLRETGKLPITDPRMTRFWINLDQGVAFVNRCLGMMRGGEVFVPKIPSLKIIDLADAIGPDCEKEIVGIRPGEKIHEVLIPRDEARLTREFPEFYVIRPSHDMWQEDHEPTYNGTVGDPVDPEFEYSSDTNTQWMDHAAVQAMFRE